MGDRSFQDRAVGCLIYVGLFVSFALTAIYVPTVYGAAYGLFLLGMSTVIIFGTSYFAFSYVWPESVPHGRTFRVLRTISSIIFVVAYISTFWFSTNDTLTASVILGPVMVICGFCAGYERKFIELMAVTTRIAGLLAYAAVVGVSIAVWGFQATQHLLLICPLLLGVGILFGYRRSKHGIIATWNDIDY